MTDSEQGTDENVKAHMAGEFAPDLSSRLERFKKAVKRRRKLRRSDVVVVSHAKSGRTWLATMISHVYHQRYGLSEREIIQFDNFHRIDSRCRASSSRTTTIRIQHRILFSHREIFAVAR